MKQKKEVFGSLTKFEKALSPSEIVNDPISPTGMKKKLGELL